MIDFSLYVITDERYLNVFNIYEAVERAIFGGATVIQYRAKRKTAKEMFEEASLVREATKHHDIPFIVNDRLDLALAVEADGVHLGQEDLPIDAARRIAGNHFIIGLSTHNLNEVEEASKEKFVDYIGFGPIFPTTTKENPAPTTGTKLLCEAVKISSLPVVAIGGINESNVDEVLKCKPAGIAVVRAAFESGDPYENVKKLREKIEGKI
ncbi:thiamine-phosphate pyrophosphorylase [Desulfurobacterium pacificum]|uniref:Thiamine-phosphate synthase n=1 Tax=Desulfurobacterium pacificum TaxID=240166 RepID=A0ABY1NUG4_9BACT|nr:thiamine phosphate synthase [Desulfurobacterium pacificum]SMP18724.1 thiamine-phosphate pyrophosphorylase [Desulfurobacterium pacificum]